MRDTEFADWVFASLPVVATAAFAFVANGTAPDFYYFISQEDHWVEWSTVWAFLLAAIGYAVAAHYDARVRSRLPWFLVGLAAFCLVVAMEEISWGQRLFSYRPPAYFLEDNFQQEFNLHNVVDSVLRQWALQAVILGYGVVMPLVIRLPLLRRWQVRLGIVPAPLQLVPAFAATSAMYYLYPLSLTGEWVELMLGLAMSLAAADGAARLRAQARQCSAPGPALVWAAPAGAAFALGLATLWLTALLHAGSPQALGRARAEIAALARDFGHERVATRCGVHKRVYTFQREYGQSYLRQGAFANRQWESAEASRGEFFLDPWNMPYWVRHACTKDRKRELVYVYSFGPNRRRDSSKWELEPDDIGAAPPLNAPAR